MFSPLSPPSSCAPVRACRIAAILVAAGALFAGVGQAPGEPEPVARGVAALEPVPAGRRGFPAAAAYEANWPQWRGPLATGVAPSSDPPARFGAAAGVMWKTEIPGRGQSSPIVWGDLVFVTTAVPTEPEVRPSERPRRRRLLLVPHEFRLIALDRGSGEVRWSRTAITAEPHEGYHRTFSSYANASPVTDGERVYAFFGSRGLYAYDLHGEPVWSRDFDVEMESYGSFGEASGPALHGDTIVVLFDHEGQSFIEAVDVLDGRSRWKRLREEDTSWTTPLIVEHGGRTLAVASGGNFVTAYDLGSGEVVWRARGMTPHPIPTPVAGEGLLIAVSGSRERRALAIRLGRQGNLTRTDAIAWSLDRGAPYNPSPLLWDDELYLVRDGGLNVGSSRLSLLDVRTGEPAYLEESIGGYSIKASPVGAAGRIYLPTEEGDVLVIRRGPDPELLAVNRLGEPFIASPAIAGDELYLRGRRHLFCIAHPESSRR